MVDGFAATRIPPPAVEAAGVAEAVSGAMEVAANELVEADVESEAEFEFELESESESELVSVDPPVLKKVQ